MSIRKKLYWGFGLILITVFGLFLVNMFAVLHEHSARDTAKKAVEMVQAMSKLEQVRQQNRLRLRNFLLNGDTKEFDALTEDEQRIDGFIANAEDKASALAEDIRQTHGRQAQSGGRRNLYRSRTANRLSPGRSTKMAGSRNESDERAGVLCARRHGQLAKL